jgi:hypothetical protein
METIEGPAVERVVREAPPYYGTVVANEFFGNYKIRIFSDGYIQVSMGLGLIKGRIDIEFGFCSITVSGMEILDTVGRDDLSNLNNPTINSSPT